MRTRRQWIAFFFGLLASESQLSFYWQNARRFSSDKLTALVGNDVAAVISSVYRIAYRESQVVIWSFEALNSADRQSWNHIRSLESHFTETISMRFTWPIPWSDRLKLKITLVEPVITGSCWRPVGIRAHCVELINCNYHLIYYARRSISHLPRTAHSSL